MYLAQNIFDLRVYNYFMGIESRVKDFAESLLIDPLRGRRRKNLRLKDVNFYMGRLTKSTEEGENVSDLSILIHDAYKNSKVEKWIAGFGEDARPLKGIARAQVGVFDPKTESPTVGDAVRYILHATDQVKKGIVRLEPPAVR